MKIQIATLAIFTAIGFTACETTTPTNANRAAATANSNTAVVVNSNGSVVANAANAVSSTVSGNTNANTATSVNYNGTREELEKNRTNIEAEAKKAGRTIGAGANDWYLWTKTRGVMVAANDLRDSTVDVDVDNAVVTLSGTVANKEQKAKAVQLAKSIEGVKTVTDKLVIKANDTVLPNASNANTATTTKKG